MTGSFTPGAVAIMANWGWVGVMIAQILRWSVECLMGNGSRWSIVRMPTPRGTYAVTHTPACLSLSCSPQLDFVGLRGRYLRDHAALCHVSVTEEGLLFTWGRGGQGRLGHGDEVDVEVPKQVMATGKPPDHWSKLHVSIVYYWTSCLRHETTPCANTSYSTHMTSYIRGGLPWAELKKPYRCCLGRTTRTDQFTSKLSDSFAVVVLW
jgi:hypothetical protein